MLKEEVIKEDICLRGDSVNEMAMISTELSERHIGVSGDMWMRQGAIKSEIVSDRVDFLKRLILYGDQSCKLYQADKAARRKSITSINSSYLISPEPLYLSSTFLILSIKYQT